MSFKPYPQYKDSGIEWLSSVPEKWEVRKLKHVSSVTFSSVDKHSVEGEEPVRLCNYTDVYNRDFITEDIEFMQATASPDEYRRFKLKAGDVLITKDSESWDDIAVPAYVVCDFEDVLCGYHLAHLRPHPQFVIGTYLYRVLAAGAVNHQYRIAANGITRFGLGKYWLDNSLLPVPPVSEQRAIAAFLDRETGRIDELIGKKERQIELLQEKRQALISHAVTKGLDPNAKLKDSGIEWLGMVPEGWEVMPVRRIVEEHKQGYYTKESYVDEGVRLLRITDIDDFSNVSFDDCPKCDVSNSDRIAFAVRQRDFLFARSGTIGRFGIVRTDDFAIFASYLIRFRFVAGAEVEFLKYYFLSPFFRNGLISDLHGGANQNVHAENIKNQFLALPRNSEQLAIAAFLDRETGRIDELMERIRASIEKLREYRTALISAAVTGKIDVREEV